MLTEAQKDSTMKVDEPKTPFIRYNPETDEVSMDGMLPYKYVKSYASPSTHYLSLHSTQALHLWYCRLARNRKTILH